MVLGHQLLIPTIGGSYQDAVLKTNPIAYWPLDDNGGSVARDISGNGFNGIYSGTIFDGTLSRHERPVPRFPGVAAFVNIFSAGLAAAWDLDEFVILAEIKPFNTGVWTDTANRRWIRLQTDVNNEAYMRKTTVNNTGAFVREGNGTVITITDATFATDDWHTIGISASIGGGDLLAAGESGEFRDSALVGAAAIGNLAASASGLSATNTVIGAANTGGVQGWNGYISDVVLYDVSMTAAILALQGLI